MPPKRRPVRGRTPARRPRTRGFLKLFLLVVGLGAAVGLGGLAYLWPRCSGAQCPSVQALRTYTPPQATQVLDRDNRVLANLAPERRVVVPLDRIPAQVSGAFLAVEDKRFYRHHGIDWRRAGGALVRDLRSLSFREGFSTITMQLARNVFPEQLTRAKTLRRKTAEVVLAWQIERSFKKDEILELYLNQIYLGNGLYGVEAAAQGYFGKSVSQLTDAEAATLAAMPKAPSFYDPRRNREAVIARRNLVLDQMAHTGVIEPAAAEKAKRDSLKLVAPSEAGGAAPYFVAEVRRELVQQLGPDAETRGYRVYTTLDPDLQAAAERELVKQIQSVEAGKLGRFRGPRCANRQAADASGCLQGMFVALDPASGDVLALVGGRDYAASQFDRATQAKRQAGSAFKPIVFAAAIADGVPVTTPLLGPDAVDSLGDYRPADHVSDSADVNLRDALRLSSNRAAVVLGNHVGITAVAAEAKNLGLSTPMRPYPSSFIGATEVVPMELVASYSVFATGGALVRPRLIRKVVDADGRTVYEAPVRRRFVLQPSVAFLTTSLMRDVVDRGTGIGVREALPYAVPAAGKTGTTDDGADVWFVGVTPDYVAGVWMGFDRPQTILGAASGGGLAAPVWGRVAAEWYRHHATPTAWVPSPDLQARQIDRRTGKLATPNCPPEDVVTEYFLAGTEPTEACPLHADGLLAPEGGSFISQAANTGSATGDDGQQEPPAAPPPPPPVRRPRPLTPAPGQR